MKEKVKCAVIGLRMGGVHVASLAKIDDAEIVAVVDLDAALAQKTAEENGARAYTDWRVMLDSEPELDAVLLVTPAKVRREPIEAICERGLALFCEKPPAISLEEGLHISGVIERAGILNTVGFMYRWSPLADIMRDVALNRPRLFARGVVAWPVFDWVMKGGIQTNLFSKAVCGGPLIEQAIHFQDVLRYVTGDEPLAVQSMAELGQLYQVEGRDCEETTAYMLRHESGMLSTHIQNWSHQGTLLQIQVVGENFDLTWSLAEPEMWLKGTVDGKAIDERSSAHCHFEEMVGFIRAVKLSDQSLMRSPYTDACRSMAVCDAAARSISASDTVKID